MKVEVKQLFRDKITKQSYQVGAVIEFEDERRVADMVERGLADIIIDVVTDVEEVDMAERVEKPTPKKSKSTK